MTCPECGGPMDIDRRCLIEEIRWTHPIRGDWSRNQVRHTHIAAAALCTRCECCIELTREQLRTASK